MTSSTTARRTPRTTLVLVGCVVVLALGVTPNSELAAAAGLTTGVRDAISVDDHQRTSAEGVYAVGDIVRGASLVVWAIRDGREAAESIAGYLTGEARVAAE